MPILALVGNKGGAGKTTLSVNLATLLNARAPTLLLDADPQRSSLQWRNLAADERMVTVLDAVDDLPGALETARRRYEYLVLDCPPSVHAEQTAQALELCDLALIPVQPSPLDLWASVYIEERLQAAQAQNPALRAYLVINQLEPRTRLSRQMRQALAEMSLPAAATAIHRRMVYRSAVLEGRTVLHMGRRGAAATEEIEALIREVLSA
jgi:chromosome partitioning protein